MRFSATPSRGRRLRPKGQFIGAVIMFWVLGFIPGYILSWILKQAGLLRVPREVELAGLDHQVFATMVKEDQGFRSRAQGRRLAPAE
jgi:ammonia channel protein AmtB